MNYSFMSESLRDYLDSNFCVILWLAIKYMQYCGSLLLTAYSAKPVLVIDGLKLLAVQLKDVHVCASMVKPQPMRFTNAAVPLV